MHHLDDLRSDAANAVRTLQDLQGTRCCLLIGAYIRIVEIIKKRRQLVKRDCLELCWDLRPSSWGKVLFEQFALDWLLLIVRVVCVCVLQSQLRVMLRI